VYGICFELIDRIKEVGEVVEAVDQAAGVGADYYGSLGRESEVTRGLDEGLGRGD
jgi:hypothetical protein